MARRPQPWFWKARARWFVTIDGRRHDLGPDKAEAFDRFYALMRQPRQQPRVSSEQLVAIIDAFLEWCEKHRAAETYEWYRYRLQRFAEHYPDLRSADLRPYHVQKWVDQYSFSVTSRRNYLRSVKRCLKWAKKQGYIDTNPIEDLEVPTAQRREVAVTQAEYQELLANVRNRHLVDLIIVTRETGCRPQESLRVEARHVDLANQRWVIQKSESKTKRLTRVVYLPDKALEITKRLVAEHPTGRLFRNNNGKPWTTDAVNCGFFAVQMRMGKARMRELGEVISEEAIEATVPTLKQTKTVKGEVIDKKTAELRCEAKRKLTHRRAAELAPRYSLYALRHGWATNALQNGLDALTVAILMGHEDPSTLSKVYQHLALNPQHMLEQAKRAAC